MKEPGKSIAFIAAFIVAITLTIASTNAGGLTPWAYLPYVAGPGTWTPTPTVTNTATSTPLATATSTPTPTATNAPTNTPLPTNTSTPVATATPGPQPTGNITIVSIHFDGTGSSEPDEYVVIRNDDNHGVQLQNWTLRDNANHVFTFPSYVMQPGETCRVYTNENHPEWCGFNYGSSSAIWNNGGDCAFLRNAGNALVDQFCY